MTQLYLLSALPVSWTPQHSMYLAFGIIGVFLPLIITLLAWQRKQDRDMVCSKLCIVHNRERIEDIHDSLDEVKKSQGASREALARVEENQKNTKDSLDKLVNRIGG